jgi:branched-subunit amino acid transport protein AzlD
MEPTAYLLAFIALAALATFLTRALPFLLLAGHAEHEWLQFLGRFLPPVLMVLLLVYALKTPLVSGVGLVQSLLALALVVLLHLTLRNALVSILGGTAGYMLMVQQWMPL